MTNITISDASAAAKPILARDNGDGSFTFYHADLGTLPSGVTALAGSTATTTTVGPFNPVLKRDIILTLSGAWAGSVQLVRSTNNGTTKLALTIAGSGYGTWNSNINEAVWSETEAAATFYLIITPSSGTVTYRLAQ